MPLIYIVGIQPSEYAFGICATEEMVFRFRLHVVFDDLLHINSNTNANIVFTNQYADKILQIQNNNTSTMEIEVFQIDGKRIFTTHTFQSNYNLHYQNLNTGYLIVKVTTENNVPHVFSLVNY